MSESTTPARLDGSVWANSAVRSIPHHQILDSVKFAEDEDGGWVFEINLTGSAIPLTAESAIAFSRRLEQAIETMKAVERMEREDARRKEREDA